MRRLTLALVLASAALLPATHADAGQQSAASFVCNTRYAISLTPPHLPDTTNPIGYYCNGTLAGARASTTSTDYVSFSYGTSGSISASFSASFNGEQFSCVAPASMAAQWGPIQLSRGFFSVWMDAAGNCTSVSVNNSSAYVNY